MFGLKMGELLIILVIIMLLFGAAKLPQLGNSLGSAIRNFKKGFNDEQAPTGGQRASLDSPARLETEPKQPTKEG